MNVKEELDERSEVLYAVRWTSVKDTCLVRKEISLKITNVWFYISSYVEKIGLLP